MKRGGEGENPEDYVDPETPSGEKKRMARQMAKQYSPTAVEKSWVLIPSLCSLHFKFMKLLNFYMFAIM